MREGERARVVWLTDYLTTYLSEYCSILAGSRRQVVGSLLAGMAGWLCMPDCLSLGGNPSSTTKLYSSLPNLVHGTILSSEGSRTFRGASGRWAQLGDVESADHHPPSNTTNTVIAATNCHQKPTLPTVLRL